MLSSDDIVAAIAPFCDPGTGFDLREAASQLELAMMRDGDERRYLFDLSTGTIKSRGEDERKFVSLASLLASDNFADVRWMTDLQRRMVEDLKVESLLEPDGYFEQGTSSGSLSADTLRNILTPKRTDALGSLLKIVLIDGPAGVGKTTLIRRLLSERANSPETAPPVLHVTSRGRRLTNLSDALAQATQAVRARFTYDQVPTLVRYGVLQIAIDGFDELVDADGYKDAWFALASFFDDVRSGGPIILSGRDTFFDEQSFRNRLFRGPRSLELSQVHLTSVSPERAQEFLIASEWDYDEVRSGSADYLRPGSYVLRPYFLSQIAEAKTWAAFSPPATTMRTFLIGQILQREAHLLSEMVEIDHEDSLRLLQRLFSEIALDMADNEADSIDLDVVALFVEVVFEAALSSDDLAKVRHKAGSLATLETDQRPSRRRFSHSEIANVFLSQALLDALQEGSAPRFIRRGIIGIDLQEALQDVVSLMMQDDLTSVLSTLDSLMAGSGIADRQASNCAAMRLALSTPDDTASFELSHIAIDEARLPDTAPHCILADIQIGRLDARDSDIRLLEFKDVSIGTLVVTDSTKVSQWHDDSIPYLEIHEGSRFRTIHDRAKVKEWLEVHADEQSVMTSGVANEFSEYLERICRKALRLFYLTEAPGRSGPSILQNPCWPAVKEVLNKHGRLQVRENLGARGPRKEYYHIIDVDALLDRSDDKAKAVWNELYALP